MKKYVKLFLILNLSECMNFYPVPKWNPFNVNDLDMGRVLVQKPETKMDLSIFQNIFNNSNNFLDMLNIVYMFIYAKLNDDNYKLYIKLINKYNEPQSNKNCQLPCLNIQTFENLISQLRLLLKYLSIQLKFNLDYKIAIKNDNMFKSYYNLSKFMNIFNIVNMMNKDQNIDITQYISTMSQLTKILDKFLTKPENYTDNNEITKKFIEKFTEIININNNEVELQLDMNKNGIKFNNFNVNELYKEMLLRYTPFIVNINMENIFASSILLVLLESNYNYTHDIIISDQSEFNNKIEDLMEIIINNTLRLIELKDKNKSDKFINEMLNIYIKICKIVNSLSEEVKNVLIQMLKKSKMTFPIYFYDENMINTKNPVKYGMISNEVINLCKETNNINILSNSLGIYNTGQFNFSNSDINKIYNKLYKNESVDNVYSLLLIGVVYHQIMKNSEFITNKDYFNMDYFKFNLPENIKDEKIKNTIKIMFEKYELNSKEIIVGRSEDDRFLLINALKNNEELLKTNIEIPVHAKDVNNMIENHSDTTEKIEKTWKQLSEVF